jgi:hypothetical protein
MVRGQPRQKVSKTPPSTSVLGTVAHACHPSYVEKHELFFFMLGPGQPGIKVRLYLKNNQSKKHQ